MNSGNIVGSIDVAELAFYAFVLFFVVLLYYLRREDRREGYPLEDELTGMVETPGGPLTTASTKYFKLPDGKGTVSAPTSGRDPFDIAAKRRENFGGAPYSPTGNPLKDGIGPAGYAQRSTFPDRDSHGNLRIVPMATVADFSVNRMDRNPIGMSVIGADGKVAGKVTELWVDRAEHVIRYLEVDTGAGHVLAPMPMANVGRGRIVLDAINAADFAEAPTPQVPGQITRDEEERIVAYFGGGYLYANIERQEPWL